MEVKMKKKCPLCRRGFTPQDPPVYVEFYKAEIHESCLEEARKLFKKIKESK